MRSAGAHGSRVHDLIRIGDIDRTIETPPLPDDPLPTHRRAVVLRREASSRSRRDARARSSVRALRSDVRDRRARDRSRQWPDVVRRESIAVSSERALLARVPRGRSDARALQAVFGNARRRHALRRPPATSAARAKIGSMIPQARMLAPWWKRLLAWMFGDRCESRCGRCSRPLRECGMFLVSNASHLHHLCGACALEEVIRSKPVTAPAIPARQFLHVHRFGEECPEHPTPIRMPVAGPGVSRKG